MPRGIPNAATRSRTTTKAAPRKTRAPATTRGKRTVQKRTVTRRATPTSQVSTKAIMQAIADLRIQLEAQYEQTIGILRTLSPGRVEALPERKVA